MKKPILSIVIPLYRKNFLQQQIFHLSMMPGFSSDVEVIYVENPAKTQEAADIIKQWPTLNIQHIESAAGANCARNRGIEFASSDKIALIDDDCIPEQRWLSALLSVYTLYPHVGIFGGPLRLNFLFTKPRWLEGYLLCLLGKLERGANIQDVSNLNSELDAGLISGNLSFYKDRWETYGRFEEHLGQRGGLNPGGTNEIDEILFVNRCGDIRNYPAKLYVGDMSIWHQIDQNRASIENILKKAYTHGAGTAMMMLNSERLKDLYIEDFYTEYMVSQWESVLNYNEISTMRQIISHEESLRIYIKYAILARTQFMAGFTYVMSSSGRQSYEAMIDTNRLFFIGPTYYDQFIDRKREPI